MGASITGVTCPKCQWSDFFKAQACPRCSTELIVASFPGQGRIVTFTVIRYPPSGFEDQVPYVVALVDLNGGPRVVGRLNAKPNEVMIGSNVNFSREANGALEFALT